MAEQYPAPFCEPFTTLAWLAGLTERIKLGAGTVALDPFNGDPDETRHPEAAWHALATVSARARHLGE